MRVAEGSKDTCMRKLRHFKVLTVPGVLTDIFLFSLRAACVSPTYAHQRSKKENSIAAYAHAQCMKTGLTSNGGFLPSSVFEKVP
ncbi:hypothetical protein PGIGA_G00225320 [Pangasianodon gigas]|uniref:Uncharacterized protein n=1 Tax=Pangasianodon gigas TaxID=30993 RepID=A0ACC5WK46_PANGG|nr:hypothetical protein [Pangasianodon gigas]